MTSVFRAPETITTLPSARKTSLRSALSLTPTFCVATAAHATPPEVEAERAWTQPIGSGRELFTQAGASRSVKQPATVPRITYRCSASAPNGLQPNRI